MTREEREKFVRDAIDAVDDWHEDIASAVMAIVNRWSEEVEEVNELGFDEVEAIGLDGTGRDGDPRFPYTWANLTDDERRMLRTYRETQS